MVDTPTLACSTVMKTNADSAYEYNCRICRSSTFIDLKMYYKVVFLVTESSMEYNFRKGENEAIHARSCLQEKQLATIQIRRVIDFQYAHAE